MKKTIIIISIIIILLIFIGFNHFNHNEKNDDIDQVADISIIENTKNIAEINYSKLEKFDIKLTETLQIKKGGIYYLEGTIDDGQIYIDTKDNVKLVLNNVNITNKNGPAIMVENANQVYIELASNSVNYLIDGNNYTVDLDGEPNATIFSKDDLIFDGDGKLVINSNYADGIVSKDNLKIMDGIYEINSLDDAIRGKDSLVIIDGSFNINSLGDGLKATNNIVINNGDFIIDSSDDSIHSNEYIGISNGNFIINSGDDGIHADNELIIDGGNVNIEKSYEGLEAESITINDGIINITSSDDGINAAGGNDASALNNRPGMNNFEGNGRSKIQINGGNIFVNSNGDGIDANGSIYITGGTVIINGPTDSGNGAIDYDGEFKITSGTLVASGTSGMAQGFSNSSTQNSIMINFPKNINANELISIYDSNDTEILTYKSIKKYQNLVISTSSIKSNESYTIYTGGSSTSEEVNGLYDVGSYKDGSKYTTFITNNPITNVGNSSGFNHEMNMGPNGPGRRP